MNPAGSRPLLWAQALPHSPAHLSLRGAGGGDPGASLRDPQGAGLKAGWSQPWPRSASVPLLRILRHGGTRGSSLLLPSSALLSSSRRRPGSPACPTGRLDNRQVPSPDAPDGAPPSIPPPGGPIRAQGPPPFQGLPPLRVRPQGGRSQAFLHPRDSPGLAHMLLRAVCASQRREGGCRAPRQAVVSSSHTHTFARTHACR